MHDTSHIESTHIYRKTGYNNSDDFNTTSDQDGGTTLIESIFFWLSLEEENTYYVGLDMIELLPDLQKLELLSHFMNQDMEIFHSPLTTFSQAQKKKERTEDILPPNEGG